MSFSKLPSPVLLILFLLIISSSAVIAQNATLESVELSKEKIVSWCPLPREIPNAECGKQQTQIRVRSVIKNPNNDSVNYNYIVSGGEIEGQGANVTWNLQKAQPGNHSITVGLGDRKIIRGKTVTKVIVIEGCPICDLPCECASVSISGPEYPIKPGEAFVVVANMTGGEDAKYRKIKWTVSDGTIVEGQGTSQILVRVSEHSKAKTVKVTFTIPTACSATCPNDITEEFHIEPKPIPRKLSTRD